MVSQGPSGFPSRPSSTHSPHQPRRRTGGSISRAPLRRLQVFRKRKHSPCCLQPTTRTRVNPDTPKPNRLLRSPTTCSTAPTQGFWPLTRSASPTDERLRSARGPSSNRTQPNTHSTRRHQPWHPPLSGHRRFDTEVPRRLGWQRSSSPREGTFTNSHSPQQAPRTTSPTLAPTAK